MGISAALAPRGALATIFASRSKITSVSIRGRLPSIADGIGIVFDGYGFGWRGRGCIRGDGRFGFARFLGAGEPDDDFASAGFTPVKGRHGGLSQFFGRHLDKAKAA